jgi:uncharacterized iron-regulated membrane protein
MQHAMQRRSLWHLVVPVAALVAGGIVAIAVGRLGLGVASLTIAFGFAAWILWLARRRAIRNRNPARTANEPQRTKWWSYVVMVALALLFVGVAAVVVDLVFAVILAFIFLVTGLLSLVPVSQRGRPGQR